MIRNYVCINNNNNGKNNDNNNNEIKRISLWEIV